MKSVINHDYFNYSLTLVLGSILVFLPVISDVFPNLDGAVPVFLNTLICSLVLISWIFYNKFKNTTINIVDIFFSMYICYGILRIGTSKETIDPIIICEWTGLSIIYIIVRLLDQKFFNILYLSLLAGGTLQAIIGILQFLNIIESNNLVFKTTGSFSNPGHLGGFLALSLIISLSFWKEQKYTLKNKNIIYPCILVIQVLSLILSDSRAAWLAVIVSLFFLYYFRVFSRNYFFKLIPFVLIVILLASLYCYKKESADVRILTWNSSLLMISDAPIFGHGIGSFASNYMPYQAQFLDEHSTGKYPLIADNNILAFNEFIHLACEQGLIGMIIFFGLLASAFTTKNKSTHLQIARSSLICLCVFASFSYPSSIFPLKVCFPLFIGILAKYRVSLTKFILSKAILFIITSVIIGGIIFNVQIYFIYREAYISLLNTGQLHNDLSDYSNIMMHNKNYLYLLSERYLKHNQMDKSLHTKKLLLNIAPTSSLLCDVGMIYLHKNELDSANNCFLFARRMTPNHITPVYGLWLTSKAKGDREQCLLLSQRIISLPVRVVNNVVLKARKDARDYIHEQTTNQ